MVESIFTVALEVVKCLAPPTERQISYLRSYTSNLENLREGIKKLKDHSESVQHAVDEAERNGEVIEQMVQEWLGRVNKAIVEAEQFVGDEAAANNRCFKGLCPNLKARLQRSKEAVTRLEVVSNLRNEGRFDRISYRSSPEDIQLLPSKDYEAFESRMSILKNILAALKNPDVNMVGIYGMGGIGKTTLAKDVARQAESDKIFDLVVFAEVSQIPDIKKIQGEIALKLGVKLEEEIELSRASRLWNRIKKEKKILLILDNMWDTLDLLALGIPHGDHHEGCKILLTARSRETLLTNMDCRQNFRIGVLDDEEASRLFKKMAGDYIETSQYKSLATGVMKECAGLPVSIVVIARALRNKPTSEWRDALRQLRRPSSSANYKNMQKEAYTGVELSYNYLESEELKKVFLLIGCTHIKCVDDLLMYGMSLDLFQGIRSMEEARDRVQKLVNKIKDSCMLLEHINKRNEWFSMHDVVRDVAISLVSANVELHDQWKLSDDVLSEVPKFSRLEFLSIIGDRSSSIIIPDNFFTKMTRLRVLAWTDKSLFSLPSSLCCLTNLRTLCLNLHNLEDIAVVGALTRLEILRIEDSRLEQFPKEVDQLTQLRILDLRGCRRLKVIPPNVLSKLSLLEELYMYCFKEWDKEGLKNASPDELKKLPNLTSLELRIEDVNILPKGLFFAKLERYKIHLGVYTDSSKIVDYTGSRIFMFNKLNANISLKDGLIVQLKGVEKLSFNGLQEEDIDYFASKLLELKLEGEFLQLRSLELLHDCAAPINTRELKHLGSVSPYLRYLAVEAKQMTWICQFAEDFFCQLKFLDIFLDDSFKKNFALVADLFPRFYTMKFLHIYGRLVVYPIYSFATSEAVGIIREVNEFGDVTHILKSIACLHNLEELNIEELECDNLISLMPSSAAFDNLTTLVIYRCEGFKKLLTSSTSKILVQLRKMEIDSCDTIEEIVADDEGDGEAKDEIIFRELKVLEFRLLSSLKSFCSGNRTFIFPSLERLRVQGCCNMKIFSGGELSTPMLQKVQRDFKSRENPYIWEDNLNTTIQQLYLEETTKRAKWKHVDVAEHVADAENYQIAGKMMAGQGSQLPSQIN